MIVAAALSAAAASSAQAETLYVDLSGWSAVGTGVTNGWSLTKISSYSDGTVQFGSKESEAVSPRFRKTIVEVRANIKCTSEATRFLAFAGVDENGAVLVTNRAAQAPSADNCREQVFSFDPARDVRRLRIFFTDITTGSLSKWGFDRLEIVLDDATERIYPPTGLRTTHTNGWSFAGEWTGSEGEVACLVSVYRFATAPASCTTNETFSFPTTRSDRQQAYEVTDSVPARFPGFGGTRLYEPANAANGLQIGARDKPGLLTHEGRSDYSDLALCLRLHRPEGDSDGRVMPLYWIDGTATNDLGVLTLTTTPTDYFVPLCDVPGGAMLAISSTTNIARSGRVIVSGMSFVSDFVPEHSVTNFVVRDLPAANDSVQVKGLERSTEYFWHVSSLAASGFRSDPSETASFKTTDEEPPGLTVRIR